MIQEHSTRVEEVKQIWQPEKWVHINARKIAFPSFEGKYVTSGKQIIDTGALTLITGKEMPDLLYSAYCSDRDLSEMKDIRGKMNRKWLWQGTRNFWFPKQGALEQGGYFIQEPRAIGLTENLSREELEEMLKDSETYLEVRFNPEKGIAFAPRKTYNFGEHSLNKDDETFLGYDGMIIGWYGPEGAEKMGEVANAQEFENKPYMWGVNVSEGENPVQRVSSVGGYSGGLDFNGYYWGDDVESYAFGVSNVEQGKE